MRWYTVTAILSGQRLDLLGHLDIHHGPGMLTARFDLQPGDDGTTLLKFKECMFGAVTDKLISSLDEGWTGLLMTT